MNSATRPRPHFAGRSSESGALGRVRFAGGRISQGSDQRTGDAARAHVALGNQFIQGTLDLPEMGQVLPDLLEFALR